MSWLLAWPVFTSAFMLFPALATMATVIVTKRPYATAAASVAEWLLTGDAEQDVDMASGFGFLAVMVTIVIGIAFSLPPEGVQALPKKNRGLIEFLTLGVTLVVSLFSTVVLWILLWRQVTLELVLLLLSAWLVTVVAGLVELKRPVAERVSAAGREREKLREGARKFGFIEGMTITRRQRVGAEAAYWLAPLVGLPLLAGVGLVCDFGGVQIDHRAWALLLVLGWGAGMMAVGWRSTAPLPPHKLSDQAFSWIVRGAGLFLMVLVVLGAYLAKSWWFAALSALSIAVAAPLYLVAAAASRVPFMKMIRDAATTKRLVQADEWYGRVLQELDGEQEREPSTPPSEAEPEPMIRIELFRRRAKRRR